MAEFRGVRGGLRDHGGTTDEGARRLGPAANFRNAVGLCLAVTIAARFDHSTAESVATNRLQRSTACPLASFGVGVLWS
jgi:hypothetical protein